MVAERRAALADHDVVGAARGLGLGDDLLHVLGREELPLLDVDRLAGARDRLDEIGLPAQERRRLQHVDHGRDLRHLGLGVHVGQHRHADLALHFRQDAQAFVHARPAERRARAAVGLVVGRLEDERDAERGADLLAARRRRRSAAARDSTTQGPAIRNSGRSSPTSKPHSFIGAHDAVGHPDRRDQLGDGVARAAALRRGAGDRARRARSR